MTEDSDPTRMTKVIGDREYDTETAIEVYHFTVRDDTPEVIEALYRSPRGQLFTVRFEEHDSFDFDRGGSWISRSDLEWRLFKDGSDDLRLWLEEANAPRPVYEAVGFEIEEG